MPDIPVQMPRDRTLHERSPDLVLAKHNVDTLRQLALEVIQRPTLDDRIDKVEAYDILSDVAETTDEALAYLEKARKLATADGESPAHWLIDELELRLLRGEAEKFLQLMKEIQTRYIKEPGVGAALLEVLSRYGLVTPDGRVIMPTTRDVAAAADIHEGHTQIFFILVEHCFGAG